MERKYEFTGETQLFKGVTLHRIKALRSFGWVSKGDVGGWIESENNLSHDGECWVYDNAAIYGNAMVTENAVVARGSLVFGDAFVYGDAVITNGSRVYDHAKVCGRASISEYSEVLKTAMVCDHARVDDHSVITDNAIVRNAVCVTDHAIIGWNARITSYLDYFVVGPVDSYGTMLRFYKDNAREGCLVVYDGVGGAWATDLFEEMVRITSESDFEKERILSIIESAKRMFGVSENA